MRALAIAALLVCLASCSRTPEAAKKRPVENEEKVTTYLASVNIPLQVNERLESFRFDTWGVNVIAVCHIPPGWRITGGRSVAADGVISGEGSHGVSWLMDMKPLESVVLVGLYDPVQEADEGAVPATFKGEANVETLDDPRTVKLSSANIRLSAASHCPG